MLGIDVDRKALKQYALIALGYLAISLVFFWPMTLHITTAVPGTGSDTFQSMWELWWVPYSMFTLHSSPYFSNYLFYPLGANLDTQTLAPIAGLVSMIFQPVSLAFALNMIFLIGFVLAGLFTYALAFHVTKNRTASFIAGLIYSFSPIHTIQAFGHLQFTNIEFLPLFLLLFVYMVENDQKRNLHAALAGISFVLLTFMGDIEQGLMAILLTLFVLAYFAADKRHRHKVLNKKFAMSFAVMILVFMVLASPFIFWILSSFNSGVLSVMNSQATTGLNELYSPDLFNFFIPSTYNGLLNMFTGISVHQLIAISSAERTTYIGYSVIVLMLIGLLHEYREHFKDTGVYLVALILFGLLSLGPYLQIGGNITSMPGLYLLYHHMPLFNVLREPGRFDMLLELFIAMFAAIGVTNLDGTIFKVIGIAHHDGESSNFKKGVQKYAPVIFVALILFEYNPWPASQQMLNSMYILNTTIPKAYYQIGALNDNFSVLMLPTIPNYTSSKLELYPGMELYYQTALKKPIIGGYLPRVNTTQVLSLFDVPLLVSAYYLQDGKGLVYGSPLKEDYTNTTEFFLSSYNVGFVSVIGSAYNQTELQQLNSYLTTFLGEPVYQGNNITVFSTSKVTRTAGGSVVAFAPVLVGDPRSAWQPGPVICGSSSLCSQDYLNSWFGLNTAYVSVYSSNYTAVNISVRALSPTRSRQEYVYLDNQRISILNLTTSLQSFSFSAGLHQGTNFLFFVSETDNISGTYPIIGVEDLTIGK